MKHQISPITENSEPDSASSHVSHVSHVSQLECNKSSLMFKLSEDNNVHNTTDENVTRGRFSDRKLINNPLYHIVHCFSLLESYEELLFYMSTCPVTNIDLDAPKEDLHRKDVFSAFSGSTIAWHCATV